jgi:hypothetical protein
MTDKLIEDIQIVSKYINSQKDFSIDAHDALARISSTLTPRDTQGALGACTGIPILYGFAEPVEGYAERPQDLVRVLHDMGKEIVQLRALTRPSREKQLLEALKRLYRDGCKQGWQDSYEYDMELAKQAIAEAEGE